MVTRYLYLLVFSLIISTFGCDKNDNTQVDIEYPVVHGEIAGPSEDDYDFFIGLSYSDPQPADPDYKRFYVIISCTDTLQNLENIELLIQDQKIDLEYANYGGPDFYIAYFVLQYDESFNYMFTVNGSTTEIDLANVNELMIELPENLVKDQGLQLGWETKIDPMNTYIEGFQWSSMNELLYNYVENVPPEVRKFTMPPGWLWSDENTASRSLQVGIMNFTINNRVCVVMSDGIFRTYE